MNREIERLQDEGDDQINDMGATADEIRVAVTTAFKTLIAEEDKKKIPIFTGSSTELSFPEWLKKAEKIAKKHAWADGDKLATFNERLDGGAEDFKNSMWQVGEVPTYAEWKKRMNAQYITPTDKEKLRHQLLTLKQKSDQ